MTSAKFKQCNISIETKKLNVFEECLIQGAGDIAQC